MKTKSPVKRSFDAKCEVTTPLSCVIKRNTENLVEHEENYQIPVTEPNCKMNLGNGQLPVLNIHLHVPPVTGDSNKSHEVQPIIHLHFGDLVSKLSSNSSSEVLETSNINKTLKAKPPLEVDHNYEKQCESPENIIVKLSKKSKTHKKSNCDKVEKYCKNLGIENQKGHLKSVKNSEEDEELHSNLVFKTRLPLRRSTRLANNRKLLETLEEMKKSTVAEDKSTEPCVNKKIEDKPDSLINSFGLKEAVVVLHDIKKMKKKKLGTFYDEVIHNQQEDFFGPININDFDNNGLERVEKHSCDFSREHDQQILIVNEENEQDPKNSPNVNECSDFEDLKITISGKDDGKKGLDNISCDITDSSEDEIVENSPVHNSELFTPKELEMTMNMISDLTNSPSEGKDPSLNLEKIDIGDDSTLNLNSDDSCGKKCGSDNSDSHESFATNFEEDNHQTASVKELDVERDNVSTDIENKNLLKGNTEENKLLDDYEEIDVNNPSFQLDLIKKEMKKRDMTIKEETVKKNLRQENTQIAKEVPENSSDMKKRKLSNKMAEKMPTAKNIEKVFSQKDFIPLQVSGPTKFAVARLTKIQPYSTHKAKNFKQEKLFGKTVKRHLNPKQLQIDLLKKQAAKRRTT